MYHVVRNCPSALLIFESVDQQVNYGSSSLSDGSSSLIGSACWNTTMDFRTGVGRNVRAHVWQAPDQFPPLHSNSDDRKNGTEFILCRAYSVWRSRDGISFRFAWFVRRIFVCTASFTLRLWRFFLLVAFVAIIEVAFADVFEVLSSWGRRQVVQYFRAVHLRHADDAAVVQSLPKVVVEPHVLYDLGDADESWNEKLSINEMWKYCILENLIECSRWMDFPVVGGRTIYYKWQWRISQ